MVDCAVDDNGSSAIHTQGLYYTILFDAVVWGGGEKKGAAVAVEITHLLVNYEPRQREREIGRVGRRNLELGRRTRLSSKWVPLSSRMAYVFIKEKRPVGSDLYPVLLLLLDGTRAIRRL